MRFGDNRNLFSSLSFPKYGDKSQRYGHSNLAHALSAIGS